MDRNTEINRRYWDQLAKIHPETAFYKFDRFKRGESVLGPLARDLVGDVTGKRLLHLQCHFGLDTLSLARMGAEVTGLDLSPVAIETARRISGDLGIAASFVEADVLNPSADLKGFDIVFASWGALCWISDVHAWMRTAAQALKPGGRLVQLDAHPAGMMLNLGADAGRPLVVRDPYASRQAIVEEIQGSYADASAVLDAPQSVFWAYGFEDVLSGLIGAGLRLVRFHEFECAAWPMPAFVKVDDYYWKLPESVPYVPLSFAIEAEAGPHA